MTSNIWNSYKIKDFGTIITGGTPSTKISDYYGGNYKLISPADLTDSKYITTAHKYVTKLGLNVSRKVPRNTILVGCIGNIGKIGITTDEISTFNQQINAVVCNENFDPDFIYYLLLYKRPLLESKASKVTLPILNKNNFENIELVVPNLKAQKYISSQLGTIQSAIYEQKKLQSKLLELKQSIMHHLFTKGTNNEKTKITDIGEVPESWVEYKLNEVGEVIYGIQAAVANNISPIGSKILTNKNISLEGSIDLESINYFELKTKRHFETVLKKGDILFNWRSGSKDHIGKTAIFDLDGEYTHSSFILRIRPKNIIDNNFLFYYLYYLRVSGYFLKKHGVSSVNATFNKSAIDILPVFLPEKSAQQRIVSIISTIDFRINLAQEKLGLQKQLFSTLLHELMSGERIINI